MNAALPASTLALLILLALPIAAQPWHGGIPGDGGLAAITASKNELILTIPVCSGIDSIEDTLTLFNTGTESAEVELNIPPGTQFSILEPAQKKFTLASEASRRVRVRYTPGGTLSTSGTLNVLVGDDQGLQIDLRGISHAAEITPSTRLLQFNALLSCQRSATSTILLANTGSVTDTIKEVYITSPFSLFPAPPYIIEPGRSQVVTIIFAPTVDGDYSAVFRYNGEPCGILDSVIVEGSRSAPSYSLANTDFGDVTVGGSGTALAMVNNNNKTAIRISGARIVPPTPGLSINPAQFPIRIPADGSAGVTVTFAPIAVGMIPDGVGIEVDIDSLCRTTLSADLDGYGLRGGISMSANAIAFGSLLFCQTAEDTVRLRNIGSAPVTLSSPAVLPPSAASYFAITTGADLPKTLQPGDTHIVVVRFTPGAGADAPINAVLNILSSDPLRPVLELPLAGERVSQSLALEGAGFDTVIQGLTGQSSWKLINTGTAAITIAALPIAPPFSLLSTEPLLPATLEPGDTLTVEMEFAPTLPGTYGDSLQVIGTTPCQGFAFAITGIGDDLIPVSIRWADASAAPGGIIRIPLLLDNDISRAAVTSFTASARFNGRLLVPERIIPGPGLPADWSIVEQQMAAGWVLFTAEGTTTLAAPGTLIYLEARAMLGDSASTMVHSNDSLNFYTPRARPGATAGIFRLEGICEEGDARLVRANGNGGLKQVHPNPVAAEATVDIETVEHGDVALRLYDPLGGLAATLINARLAPGAYAVRLNAAPLPAGVYYLELRTATMHQRTKVLVLR